MPTSSSKPEARRIVSWNIRHGGGRPERQREVLAMLLGFDAAVIALQEFRAGPRGAMLLDGLAAAGYRCAGAPAPAGRNTTLIACRRTQQPRFQAIAANLEKPWSLWRVALTWIDLVTVHLPNLAEKVPYWDTVLALASGPAAPCLFLGDFNTCRNDLDRDPGGMRDPGAHRMEAIAAAGFHDLWRARHPERREYSWFSHRRNGFRIDHAFGSSALHAATRHCWYDHAGRLAGLSDHAALLLEIDPAYARSTGGVAPAGEPG
jgi:exonuclease III